MRRRPQSWMLGSIVLALIFGVLATTSIQQNMQVRSHFTRMLQATQRQDDEALDLCYQPDGLIPEYRQQLYHHPPRGWKFTGISGQPWPMDDGGQWNTLKVELYYQLPADGNAPAPYAIIDHPQYGKCFVVPAALPFQNQTAGFYMPRPEYTSPTGERWVAPFVKPIQ